MLIYLQYYSMRSKCPPLVRCSARTLALTSIHRGQKYATELSYNNYVLVYYSKTKLHQLSTNNVTVD